VSVGPRMAMLVAGVALVHGTGCITPPVIFPAGSRAMPVADQFPEHAELIEIPVQDGIVLRGIFLPSDEGAPVVLHFLEAGGSVGPQGLSWTTGSGSAGVFSVVRSVFAELAHLGFASLAVDYEGVGASDGERSPRNLARDAQAAWDEALRRAGGRPDRVLVRATSIGTLAAASLLESGSRPAALVLASPVFSDSVSRNYGRTVYGAFLTALVLPFFEDVTEADLDTALAEHPVPHMIWVLDGDELLSEEDLTRLQVVADSADGRLHRAASFQEHRDVPDVVRLPRHVRGALAARNILPTELDFLATVFPDVPPELQRITEGRNGLSADLLARLPIGRPEGRVLDQRLAARLGDDPELVAWTVLTSMDDEDATRLLEYQSYTVRQWRRVLPSEAVSRRLAMDDPAGTMPLSRMLALASKVAHYDRLAEPMSVDELMRVVAGCGAPGVEKAVWNPELTTANGMPFSMRHDLRKLLWNPVSRGATLPPGDAARQTLRLVFKAAGYPERVVTDADGTFRLEVRDGDSWRVVDPAIVIEPRVEE
jgi:pimeloyl-ACP methyl ester carboxylesterase